MPRIQKVLFPTHFKNLAYSALEEVLAFAEAGLNEVIFLHVMDRDEVGFVPFGGFDNDLAREITEKARLTFSDWGKTLTEKGIRWKEVVEVGNPEPKILEVAEREAVDMIVVGRHKTLADSIYPGGVEMGVLRDSTVPVLLLPPVAECEKPVPGDIFSRVVFATDFSKVGESGLECLLGLKPALKGFDLLHVVEPDEVDSLKPDAVEKLNRDKMADLEALASTVRAKGLEVRVHLLSGDVAREVLNFASQRDSTAIVLGTSGSRGLKEIFLGSVSHKVAQDSEVPVLVTPVRR